MSEKWEKFKEGDSAMFLITLLLHILNYSVNQIKIQTHYDTYSASQRVRSPKNEPESSQTILSCVAIETYHLPSIWHILCDPLKSLILPLLADQIITELIDQFESPDVWS